MVSGSLDTVVVNRQSIPRGGYPHPPRIVNAITKQQHKQVQQQQQQHSPFQLRFSDGPLRPWPPMYTPPNGASAALQPQSPQQGLNYHGPHQYRSLIAKHNNNYQLYLNNLKNLYAYNTMKSSASANNKYNKFMFNHHQHHHLHQPEPGFMLNAPPPPPPSQSQLAAAAAAAAAKSKEQHFMQSYFRSQKNMNHQKAASIYSMKDHHGSGGGNSSSMSESEQKQQIRRLRSSNAQSMPPGSACGCNTRSKSMEDIRDVIVDWEPELPMGKQKLLNNSGLLNNGANNNSSSNYFMNQKKRNDGNKLSGSYGFSSSGNTRRFMANQDYIINGQLANIKNKNNMRRSMDNLLEIESNFTPHFNTQVFGSDVMGHEVEKLWTMCGSPFIPRDSISFRWVPFYIKSKELLFCF